MMGSTAGEVNQAYATHGGGSSFDMNFNALTSNSSVQNSRAAVVKPVFTATAYRPGGFYDFYRMYGSLQPGTYVTTNLNMLTLNVTNDWGWSSGFGKFIASNYARNNGLVLGNNSFVVTDVDVNNGKLFNSDGSRAYNVVVVGFDEYVTDAEYNQYVQFVHDGGKIILLDACNFYVKVNYNSRTNMMTLVDGHGYTFNGTAVWRGSYEHYKQQNALNFGSVYALFKTQGYHIKGATPSVTHPLGRALRQVFGATVFSSYAPHEENAIANPSDSIIAVRDVTGLTSNNDNLVVAAYELDDPSGGRVIHSGVFGSDIISFDKEMQFFLLESIFFMNSPTGAVPDLGPSKFIVRTSESMYEGYDSIVVYGIATSIDPNLGKITIQIYALNKSLFASASAIPNATNGLYAITFPSSNWPLGKLFCLGNIQRNERSILFHGYCRVRTGTMRRSPCS
jgi:hypothetical protein